MLLHQNGRRREDGNLFAVQHGLECGPQGDFGFAVANVSAQQAVHIARAFHIGENLLHALLLVRGQLVGEHILKFALPRRFVAESKSRCSLARRVKFGQVEGEFLQPGLHFALLPFPLSAAQTVQFRGAVLRADKLLHAVKLVGGDVEFIVAQIPDQQIIPRDALGVQLDHAVENTYAMSLHGKSLRRFRRHIGMIFQSFNLVTRSTVIKNVLTSMSAPSATSTTLKKPSFLSAVMTCPSFA